jgi:hypothetical protein
MARWPNLPHAQYENHGVGKQWDHLAGCIPAIQDWLVIKAVGVV